MSANFPQHGPESPPNEMPVIGTNPTDIEDIEARKRLRKQIKRIAIVAAALVLFLAAVVLALSPHDISQLSELKAALAQWNTDPTKMQLVLDESKAKARWHNPLDYKKGDYTYTLCGNFYLDLTILSGVLPGKNDLGADHHGAGNECYTLPPKPEAFVMRDVHVETSRIMLARTSYIHIWQPEGTPNDTFSTKITPRLKFFDSAGRTISVSSVQPGNTVDLYWDKDTWPWDSPTAFQGTDTPTLYKVVVRSGGPLPAFCAEADRHNASTPLCPETSTNLKLISINQGIIKASDREGKVWTAAYFPTDPQPFVKQKNAGTFSLDTLRPGETIDLIYDNNILKYIQPK